MSLSIALVAGLGACHNKKVTNPIANIDSKQPDKVLFDRAMQAMKNNRFDVSRMTLQTLINTYPDSEYVARAKLAIGDSWYAEGGTAALAQAESEYKDFETFFPNLPEAAEAQMKIANIHYKQMEKPDRDYTHARRAEDEYRSLIQQYPDSKLVPEAKRKLLQVQEVLAEREYRIGHFYYLRQTWPAAIARLRSLSDTYPLYSQADETLFELGDAYEQQMKNLRLAKGAQPAALERTLRDAENHAAEAFGRILTRYPLSLRAKEARRRLEAMHRPVPQATPEDIARHKAEIAGHKREGRWERARDSMRRHPDLEAAAKTGEPPLTDPKQTSAVEVVRNTVDIMTGKQDTGTSAVTVETPGAGTAPASDKAPHSDPAVGKDVAPGPAGAPSQINEAAPGSGSDSAQDSSSQTAQNDSSSQQKKKKGLRRVLPF
jgi:outer membrane protein assembly factor BamD